jgi:pimeloyl-ACP methyl ester carboxylesterase
MKLDVRGKSAYVYTAGHAIDPALPTVVFIHGGEQDHSAWVLQSRYFAYHRYNVLAPDLPGHGRSQGPALASIAAMADWVIAALDGAGVKRAASVGHSMGSLVALELAAHHPLRIAKIALLGTAVPMPVAEPLLDAARADDHAALDMINVWSFSPRAQIGGNTAPGLWLLGMNLRLLERQASGVLYADFKACHDYVAADAAASIQCPALVIVGSRDQMIPPRATHEFVKRLPHAQTVTLEGSGHALMAEQPDAVLDALIGFL